MVRIAVDFFLELGHQLQLRVVRADVDVEVPHVVLRLLEPRFGVVRNIVAVLDDGGLAVLGTSRSVQVEAIQPDPGAVEQISGVLFVHRLRCDGVMQVEICRQAARKMVLSRNYRGATTPLPNG
jgi:hypothetical protein